MGSVEHHAVAFSDLLGPMVSSPGAPASLPWPQPAVSPLGAVDPRGAGRVCVGLWKARPWLSTLYWPDVVGTVRSEALEREVEGLGNSAPVPLEFVTSLGTQMHKGNNPVSLTA